MPKPSCGSVQFNLPLSLIFLLHFGQCQQYLGRKEKNQVDMDVVNVGYDGFGIEADMLIWLKR